MSKKGQNLQYNTFYCIQCGNKNYSIPRRKNAQREAGHLKRLYCPYCGKEINHAECSEFGPYTSAEFYIEFDEGNFDIETGMRKTKSWRQFING